jgi:hypothetical protein
MVAGPLDALERVLEEAVEGTVRRIFRPKVQPIQIAKAAAREMEREQLVGPSGQEVANSFSVDLNPDDLEPFRRFQAALERELAKYLTNYARDRGWQPVARVLVGLRGNEQVPRGKVRVIAQMRDAPVAEEHSARGEEPPIERTVAMPRLATPLAPEVGTLRRAGDWLEGENGDRWDLSKPVTTLGRSLENDVVLRDQRVSRIHAELRSVEGSYLLRDLGSTNGTQVADEPVTERALKDGDSISLGGYRITLRLSG